MSDALKISRRTVLAGVPAAALLTMAQGQAAEPAKPKTRPRIAALATEYRPMSHAEVILDRFLEGFGWESSHHRPEVDIVSLYMDQFPAADLARERASRFEQMKIYPTISEALCGGGDKLAVDGVLIIGEHGDYKQNEKGQWLYPRYEFYKQMVDVFQKSGRTAKVFNDKHLSWNWDWAKEMVDTSVKMGFPFMAGSSLPVTWRLPSVDLPLGSELEEVMVMAPGGVDSYDFHALETAQCLVERRKGGETGVVRLQALRDDAVLKALDAGSWEKGGWDPNLFEACLCRSHMLKPTREGYGHSYPTREALGQFLKKPVAYRYEYADGMKATMLLMGEIMDDFTFAARVKGQSEPWSVQFLVGPTHNSQPFNFSPLCYEIEQFMLTGKLPYPVERTLLTTGLVNAGVESLYRNSEVYETPHLAIRYQPNPNSTFRRT